ncbi:MAG: hypothetical protein ABI333_28270 [bacterium]
MRYRERRYQSLQEFQAFETPRFDSLSDAIDGLMDAMFLDEVARHGRGGDDELFDAYDESELEWAY